MSSIKSILTLSLLASAKLVAAHGAIIKAVGDAGGSGMALGIDTSTPRDGTRRNPFQQDSTRFKGEAADTFGETVGAGTNNLEAGTKAIMAETGTQLPQVSQGGEIQMTLHQVNADGGGPYSCMINADGTGTAWQDITVTQQAPGKNSNNRQGAATDFPLNAAIPADQSCTGTVAGQDNVCLVRCQNAARAGPFGGVVPVQMANTTTPAAARRALALAVKRSELNLQKFSRRQVEEDEEEDEEEY
ncbi:hypothetical protein BR93DRAFT_984096 [Coniochaeta sp. PMI_546]|nr:hypothetical protein BR93DRAFT_984096 [Coniochaeta sp. PMI_546]